MRPGQYRPARRRYSLWNCTRQNQSHRILGGAPFAIRIVDLLFPIEHAEAVGKDLMTLQLVHKELAVRPASSL
jgi:hypothetical protein